MATTQSDAKPGEGQGGLEGDHPTFEEFSSGPDWRKLPLDIKLKVLKLLSRERDTPDEHGSRSGSR